MFKKVLEGSSSIEGVSNHKGIGHAAYAKIYSVLLKMLGWLFIDDSPWVMFSGLNSHRSKGC